MKQYRLKLSEHDYHEFSRAHMSYINQIFGDITVRQIIQEIYPRSGSLAVLTSGPEFEYSHHHIYKKDGESVCSIEMGYQNTLIDVNDNLCQSYALMSYLDIPFDKTPSSTASVEQKRMKQMAMINMYRNILENKDFVKIFINEVVFEKNNKLWTDWVNRKFYIIQKLSAARIIKHIKKVLDAWENYGWRYFVGDGTKIYT
jgi:hypothetical protein